MRNSQFILKDQIWNLVYTNVYLARHFVYSSIINVFNFDSNLNDFLLTSMVEQTCYNFFF